MSRVNGRLVPDLVGLTFDSAWVWRQTEIEGVRQESQTVVRAVKAGKQGWSGGFQWAVLARARRWCCH